MNPLKFFLLILRASTLSTGGFGNVPILHEDLVPTHFASDTQFAEAMAVGQVSPGPNGLWVVSLGYLLKGPLGALLTVIGIILPPMLVLVVERFYRRVQHHPAVEGFVRGLTAAVVGIFVFVLLKLLQATGLSFTTIAIAAVGLGLAASRRVPVIGIIGAGAVAGLFFYR